MNVVIVLLVALYNLTTGCHSISRTAPLMTCICIHCKALWIRVSSFVVNQMFLDDGRFGFICVSSLCHHRKCHRCDRVGHHGADPYDSGFEHIQRLHSGAVSHVLEVRQQHNLRSFEWTSEF